MDLSDEAKRATDLLSGRSVTSVSRHRPGEVAIEFEDGTRLFVNASTPLELSITNGSAV